MNARQPITSPAGTPASPAAPTGAESFGPNRGLAAWTYGNEALNRLEYERVILPSWQFACHVSQVAEPGQYMTLELMRDSILVMRDREGVLRAMKNVCRHRGAKLLDGSGRCKGSIVCPYHGWTYNLDGRLRATPAKKTFPGLDLGQHGLEEVEIDQFHGLVFVRVVPGGPSLGEMLGDLDRMLAPYRIEDMRLLGGEIRSEVWACNWKTGVDNNLENYHIPIGHPGYARMLDCDMEGTMNVHGAAWSPARLRAEPSVNPVERMYQRMAPEVLTDLDEVTRRTWVFATLPPNIGIDVYPDCMDIFQILPLTAETCLVRYPLYGPDDQRREARLLRYLNRRINRNAAAEDKWLCERVQRGLSTHGYQPGPLSELESAIKDFHDRIRAVIPEADLAECPPHLAAGATVQAA